MIAQEANKSEKANLKFNFIVQYLLVSFSFFFHSPYRSLCSCQIISLESAFLFLLLGELLSFSLAWQEAFGNITVSKTEQRRMEKYLLEFYWPAR